jgi:hypothetical protein
MLSVLYIFLSLYFTLCHKIGFMVYKLAPLIEAQIEKYKNVQKMQMYHSKMVLCYMTSLYILFYYIQMKKNDLICTIVGDP